MKPLINLILASTLLVFLSVGLSCKRNLPEDFDFSDFIERGLANANNKKFLTYLIVSRNDFSGLEMTCMLGIPKALEPYILSPSHDVLFLIEVPEEDKDFILDYLKEWCFEDYLLTSKTPEFFKIAKKNQVKGISYLFDKRGRLIALTNPSLPNFKDIMDE